MNEFNTYVELATELNFDDPKKKIIMEPSYYVSNKMDGLRCIWDGGMSKGIPLKKVPWCNYETYMGDKVSTGLFTRNGKPIFASCYLTDQLPRGYIFDGELYSHNLPFERIVSICRNYGGSFTEWKQIQYWVFDCIPKSLFVRPRTIMDRDKHWHIAGGLANGYKDFGPVGVDRFHTRLKYLDEIFYCHHYDSVCIVPQTYIQYGTKATYDRMLQSAVQAGWEGIMLRNPDSIWNDVRTKDLLKYKMSKEAEGTVFKVEKGSGRLANLIGTLYLHTEYGEVKVGSGISDKLRGYSDKFWLGKTVYFKFRSFTQKGKPKFPTFSEVIIP